MKFETSDSKEKSSLKNKKRTSFKIQKWTTFVHPNQPFEKKVKQ